VIYFITILTVVSITYFFSIGWIIIGFNKLKRRGETKFQRNQNSKISIIIPVRNEEKNILACLQSLQNQNYDNGNFEVIVVNDHSTDITEQLVNSFIEESNLTIRIVSLTDRTSKKEALKLGIEMAQFNIIATTDADCILPKDWLNNISSQFKSDADMLLGPVMFKRRKGFLSAFQTLDMLAIQGMEFGALGFKQPILNNAANLSYSKKAYNKVKGFDSFNTPSGDDIFLLERFKSNHQKIKGLLSHNFVVETEPETKLSDFLNQRLRWSSKSKYYSDKLLLFFSGLVLIQNILLLFIYLGILLVEKETLSFVILLFTKWLIDFILLFLVASFFKRRNAMFYFIPVQLVYPIYILIVWIASITMKFEWKGRKY